MAEILYFHHALGLTPGQRDFAEALRVAGHTVHTPDLYGGRVFDTLDAGVAYGRSLGFEALVDDGVAAAEGLPAELVYVGYSLGVLPAQRLAQTRPGAKGALFLESFVPPSEFGGWPAGVPAQVHGMDEDPIFAGEGDLDAARAFVEATPEAELFLYPGKVHLFADPGLPTYDAAAAKLLTERVLAFADRLG
ncbi:dienelactone hydrolase family protein [Phytohabitans sp. ZYX-F-186]|uniref:Dienelactone hydrolase family protein n=1 Tax=Phytohabitans maris TaxID=3071409 RepID=A0ABU0ZBZ0_9ACTN|nr:dienelactone hydrolase family protein [Phytohabitans sp. ZYX-F-186]MDQ7903845.1 dienelactone hydrolase family protein [Phytohabitans sp. ZYX-F-186]